MPIPVKPLKKKETDATKGIVSEPIATKSPTGGSSREESEQPDSHKPFTKRLQNSWVMYIHINRAHPIIVVPAKMEVADKVRINMSDERMDIIVNVSSVMYGKNRIFSPNPMIMISIPIGGAIIITITVTAMSVRIRMTTWTL